MLLPRRCILAHILSSPATYPISPIHRLLSAAAAAGPTPAFAVERYLVATCGLTRAQALKASTKLTHLKSPSKPDAVLAFLADLGLSRADVASLVAKEPSFLCTSVERTLAPIVVGLTGLGLSRSEIARLSSVAPFSFRCRSIISNLPYYLSIFGSHENLLRVLKRNPYLLSSDLENKGKPNVAFLRECGLGDCHIAKLCSYMPRLLSTNLERIRALVVCAEGLGVPRGSGIFWQALHAVAFYDEEKIAAKVEYLKKTFRWSDAEVGIAVCKFPAALKQSKDTLQSKSEFLVSVVGLEPAYIARRSVMLGLSLEGRLRPRYYVLKFLKENGLLDRDRSYFTAVSVTKKAFVEKYIIPHDEAAPRLAQDYATACRGEVPARFIFA